MSKFATPTRFLDDGSRDAEGKPIGGTWYKPAPTWENQQDFLNLKANMILSLIPGVARNVNNPTQGGRVLVAGAGFGFLVYRLHQSGYYAFGCDGTWARSEAQVRMPGLQDRMMQADVTLAADLTALRTTIGIRNQRFAAVITEDLLSCADSAAEAQTMLTVLRAEAMPTNRANVIHFITMYDPSQPWSGTLSADQVNEGLYRTEAEWVTLVGNNAERIVNLSGMRIVR